MMTAEEFSNQIKGYLKKQGFTQQCIAEKLGVSQSYVAALLNGKREFGRATAKKWSDIFGFSITFLITHTGPMLEGKDDSLCNKYNQDADIHGALTPLENKLLLFLEERDRQVAKKDEQILKKDEQIDRLLTIIEDLSSQTQKGDAASDATSADVG